MKKVITTTVLILCLFITTACNKQDEEKENGLIAKEEIKTEKTQDEKVQEEDIQKELINNIKNKYKEQQPTKWGEDIDGVVNKINTNDKVIALTFDACGGKNGSGYDKELIDYLIQENIPATLFINYRWIEENKDIFMKLAENDLFEIENHGKEHRPLSVNQNSVYGIEGTNSVEGVIDEIKLNEEAIYNLTGKKTKYFRSGTAYYDDVATDIAKELGYKIMGFSINGDGGATFTANEVAQTVKNCKEGDIVISHFNQPSKNTYEGLKEVLVNLKNQGYKFVKLEDVDKYL